MIKELKMFTIICDNCGADAFEGTEYSGYSDEGFAKEEAIEDGWKEEGENHYCPKCYKYDDDDNLVIVSPSLPNHGKSTIEAIKELQQRLSEITPDTPSLPNGKNSLAALKKLRGIFTDEERETIFDYEK
jgi:hypothetical protein